MSFLFKSSKKASGAQQQHHSTYQQQGSSNNALPPATRDIRSSDGPSASANSSLSQIPTLNGVLGGGGGGSKPGSPVPFDRNGPQSVNASFNSLVQGERDEKGGYGGGGGGLQVRGSGPPSPEQKSLSQRERGMEPVCSLILTSPYIEEMG